MGRFVGFILSLFLYQMAWANGYLCQNLFTPSAQMITHWGSKSGLFRNDEYHASLAKVDWLELIKKQKEQAESAQSILNHNGILFTVENYIFPNDKDIGNTQLLRLVISPNGEHPLNQAAKEVSEKYGYRVTYNPFVLLSSGGALSAHQYLKELIVSREFLKKFDPQSPLWLHEIRHLYSNSHPEIRNMFFYMKDGKAFPDHYIYYGSRFSFDEIRAHQTELVSRIKQMMGTKRQILDNAQNAFETAMNGYILSTRSIAMLEQLISKDSIELDGREVVTEKPMNNDADFYKKDLEEMLQEAREKQVQFEFSAYILVKEILSNGQNMTPKEIIAKTTQVIADQVFDRP